MRANGLAAIAACLLLLPGWLAAEEELPDDEFLEFLGAWDEAWSQACDPEGGLPGDDACATDDDELEDDGKKD